jgi:hypothetical protein
LRYFLAVLLALLFFGCAQKTVYNSSQAYYIVIKNPKMSIADTGFIKKNEDALNVQVFSASTPLLELEVSQNICINSLCLKAKRFNKEFFGTSHYETFINELLSFNPIYEEKNIIKEANGFSQTIKTENYEITYRVKNDTLYFKDSHNNILIKLRKL